MDWMQQSTEMMKTWSDMQKKMWESWLDAATGLGDREQNPLGDWIERWREISEKSLAALDDLTRKMVEMQGKMAASETVTGLWPGKEEDVKKAAQSWTEQTLAVMKAWTTAQNKLWADWFSAATSIAGSVKTPNDDWFDQWQKAARTSMEAWDKLTRDTMATQADWFGGWLNPTGEPKRGKSSKSAST